MKTSIFNAKKFLNSFFENMGMKDKTFVKGVVRVEVTRHDGRIEKSVVDNVVVSQGLNYLAQRGVTNTGSAFLYIAIGTQTAASSLGSTQAGMGEVDRKLASTNASSNEVMILVATWGGAADSVTSLDLRTAGACNHANSGSGEFLNFTNSVATILADSDFLKLQLEIQVGSHNL